MAEVVAEKRNWVPVPHKNGIWDPSLEDNILEGKYIKKEPAPFRGRPNTKYMLESEHLVNVGGKVCFYGSAVLNADMIDIPFGYYIKLEFKGVSPSKDPSKKGTKLFEIEVDMPKDDPLYKKLYPNDENQTSGMRTKSYPEARNMIDHYLEVLKDEFKPLNCESVLKKAEADGDLKPEDLTKIKLELIEMHKAGEILKRAQPFKKV